MTISRRLLGELLKGCARPEDLPGDAGLMKEFEIRLMEWMPGAEPTAHSGHEEGKDSPPGQPNRRNGTSARRRKGQDSETPVSVPRDRDGSFEAELVKAGQTRIDGMDDKIIGLCAAGLTVRDIRARPEDVHGLQVRPGLPLGHCCAMPCRAADQPGQRRRAGRDPRMAGPGAGAHVSDCDLRRAQGQDPRCRLPHGQEQGCPCGLSMWPFAMGLGPMAAPWLTVSRDGVREVPGLWIAGNEGARFWLSVMNELKSRGVRDVLIAARDGLKGFPDAILGRLPAGRYPDLHPCISLPGHCCAVPCRATAASFPELLRLEGPQGRRRRSAADLQGRHSRSGGC